jgi:hypothetical protein
MFVPAAFTTVKGEHNPSVHGKDKWTHTVGSSHNGPSLMHEQDEALTHITIWGHHTQGQNQAQKTT